MLKETLHNRQIADFPVANFSSILKMTFCNNSVDEFKGVMYKVRNLSEQNIPLTHARTHSRCKRFVNISLAQFSLLKQSNPSGYKSSSTRTIC